MNIESVIDRLWITKKNFLCETPNNMKLFSSVANDNHSIFKEIYSNEVFPRQLRYSGESFLLWDMCFWHIYQNFLENYFFVNIAISIDDLASRDNAMNQLINSLNYFLSVRFIKTNEALSLNFASRYHVFNTIQNKSNDISDSIKDNETIVTINRYLLYSKLYCLFHEVMHHNYRLNPHTLEVDTALYKIYIDEYILLLSSDEYDFSYDYSGITREGAKAAILNTANDKKLAEEVICDCIAITDCIDLLHECDIMPLDIVLGSCIEMFRIINFFNSMIIGLEHFWRLNYLLFTQKLDMSLLPDINRELNDKNVTRLAFKETYIESLLENRYSGDYTKSRRSFYLKERYYESTFIGGAIKNMLASDAALKRFHYNYNSLSEHPFDDNIALLYNFLEWEEK